ncbi:MAG: TIGR01212 family radical SAM protein [Tannerellaceae bacterium]|jgi:radical SAM protein (TIGR01212 family)|nr:TIGR01212 family radical SAM protein [Tannerellaceae bacterium]
MLPYNDFASYLRRRFPFKVQKLSINGGRSCPNRDGSLGRGGCTYCNNAAFSPAYCLEGASVEEQIAEGIRFFAYKYPDMRYLAYFQSYTGTYGDAEQLAAVFEEALRHPRIAGLIIGTRPDCMPDLLLKDLAEMARRGFVMIEYGVESTVDESLARINRGHSFGCSAEAIRRTHACGIAVGAHLIIGLPGESREQILGHADRLSELPLTSLKMHQLQIVRHTQMAAEWEASPERFRLYSPEEYIELAIDFLERLNPAIAVERFVSQSPAGLLLAPSWGLKNHEITARIVRRMHERGAVQGSAVGIPGAAPMSKPE